MLTRDYFSDKQPCSLHRRYLNSRKRCTSPVEARQGSGKRQPHGILYIVVMYLHIIFMMCYVIPLLAYSQNVLFLIFHPCVLEALARYRFHNCQYILCMVWIVDLPSFLFHTIHYWFAQNSKSIPDNCLPRVGKTVHHKEFICYEEF